MVNRQLQIGYHVEMSHVEPTTMRSSCILARHVIVENKVQTIDLYIILFILFVHSKRCQIKLDSLGAFFRLVVILSANPGQLYIMDIQRERLLLLNRIRLLLWFITLESVNNKLVVGHTILNMI